MSNHGVEPCTQLSAWELDKRVGFDIGAPQTSITLIVRNLQPILHQIAIPVFPGCPTPDLNRVLLLTWYSEWSKCAVVLIYSRIRTMRL